MRNNIFFVLIMLCSLTSCSTMYNLRVINLEMIKPGLLPLDKIDTVAIFNRNINDSVNKSFSYRDAVNHMTVTDSLMKYQELSNACVNALSNYLDTSGYFLHVMNFKDSLKALASVNDMLFQLKEVRNINADVCLFLDYLNLNDKLMTDKYYFDKSVIYSFPEFAKSTMMETIKVKMIWSILLKGDSAYSSIPINDILHYSNSTNPNFFGNDQKHRELILNTANYLGESFAIKLVPSWSPVERTYYRSHNPQMLVAEKYLLDGDFIKAAEIYSQFINNKNPNIVAKATFNMALINEMEGNLDAAFDWITHSLKAFKNGNALHNFNCIQYSEMLTFRKKELESLDKQAIILE